MKRASSAGADDALELELWRALPGFEHAACDAERSWVFAKHVLAPLLGAPYAQAGWLLPLPDAFLHALWGAQHNRCTGGDAGASSRVPSRAVGVLLPDHARFAGPQSVPGGSHNNPVLAVEIKPKSGVAPRLTPAAERAPTRPVSRYTMHQHFKLAQGHILEVCSSFRSARQCTAVLRRPPGASR